ncbi:hypothetical protein MASR2M70_11390 [Bacillota bacterium]
MSSKRIRYLLIGLFFACLAIFCVVNVINNSAGSFVTYAIVTGLIAVLFLKNAFSRQ